MIEATILIISLSTLIISAHLYRIASGESIWQLNMLTYSFYILFVLSFFASVAILLDVPFMGYDPGAVGYLYGDFNNRLFVWGMVMWMFIGIPLGAITVNTTFLRSPGICRDIKVFRAGQFGIGWNYTDRSLYRIVFVASTLLFLLFFITMPKETPLSHVLGGGGVVEAQIIRWSFSFGFENKVLKTLFNEGILIFLSFIAFIMSYRTGHYKWRMLFILQFLTIVFLSISKGTISHVLFYLLSLAFCRALIGGKFVKSHEAILAGSLTAGLFIIFKGAEGSVLQVLMNSVFVRLFISQMLGTYYALQTFPSMHDFLWFSSSGRWLNELFTGSSSESYGIILMSFYNPEGVAAGSAGHMTSIFMAEAWVNFGIIGIILAPLWVGAVVQLVNRWFLNRPKNVILVAFYAYLSTVSFGYASDFMSFYYPAGTIMFIIGASGILLMGRLLLHGSSKNKDMIGSVSLIGNQVSAK